MVWRACIKWFGVQGMPLCLTEAVCNPEPGYKPCLCHLNKSEYIIPALNADTLPTVFLLSFRCCRVNISR